MTRNAAISTLLIVSGIAIYVLFSAGLVFVFLIQPHWLVLLIAAALLLPHLFALALIRRPMPWAKTTREVTVLILASYAAIPIGCFVFLILLGATLLTGAPQNAGIVAIALAYTITFTILSVGTSLIIGGLKVLRAGFYEQHCKSCLYDLTSVEGDTCPECNTPITRPAEVAS